MEFYGFFESNFWKVEFRKFDQFWCWFGGDVYDHGKWSIRSWLFIYDPNWNFMILTESTRSLAKSLWSFVKIIRSFAENIRYFIWKLTILFDRIFSAKRSYSFKIWGSYTLAEYILSTKWLYLGSHTLRIVYF